MDIRLDEGFLFGMGVFETIAVEQGRPLLLEQHLNRMQGSADFLKLGSCAERGLTKEKIAEYLSTQEMSVKMHGALKIVMSAENTFFQMRKNPYMDEIYSRGFMTDLSKVRRNETSQLVYHKTLNYGDCILEKRAAAAAGINEKIFINTKGQISEGTVCNVFFVRKNMIYTPQLSCGLLPGILREYIMERFQVTETIIYPDELMYYEECFVTNSLMGVMPVRQLGNICFPHRAKADEVREVYEKEKTSL